MAKIGAINKNKKVIKLNQRDRAKREALKKELRQAHQDGADLMTILEIQEKRNKLSRNSSRTRIRNRCNMNGRPRGYMRKFGMNRYSFRLLANEGKIPGVTKSSW